MPRSKSKITKSNYGSRQSKIEAIEKEKLKKNKEKFIDEMKKLWKIRKKIWNDKYNEKRNKLFEKYKLEYQVLASE